MKKKAIATLVTLSLGGVCLGLAGCGGGGSGGTIVPTPTPTPTPTPAPGAPTFAKAFSPNPVSLALGSTPKTTLTYTITNTSALPLAGLTFSDNLPTGLEVANPNNLSNGCGGTLAAAPGATSILLVNGSLAANASCTISLDLKVTATTVGSLTSPAIILTNNQGLNAIAAPIDLTVTVPAPTFTMAFVPSSASVGSSGGTVTGLLRFTIKNNAAIPLTNLKIDHTLPGGPPPLTIPSIPNNTTTCGGNFTGTNAGGSIIKFAGGSVNAGQTCKVEIEFEVTFANTDTNGTYTYPNDPVTLNSDEAAPVTVGPVTWGVVKQ